MTPRRIDAVLVSVLCLAVFVQAWTSLRHKSLTFDEVTYIPAGYSYVVTGDFRLNPEHPPLAKLLAGVALLPLHPRLDTADPAWETRDQWTFGRRFFEGSGVDTQRLVSVARIPFVLLTMLVVVAAFLFAGDLYGRGAGLLAAWLSAFSPNLLAHGRLATTDLAHACLVLLTSYAVLRFVRRPSPGRLVAAGAALGLALLTKFTAVLLLGLVPLWILLASGPERGGARAAGAPADGDAGPDAASSTASPRWRWLLRIQSAWARHAAFVTVSAAAILVIALFTVTLGYEAPGRLAPYLQGLRTLYTNVNLDIPTYFHRSFHPGGVPYYFVAAFLLKTPLPFLLLLGIRVVDQIRRRDPERDSTLFLLLPAATWLAVISFGALQFGLRYILPVYPLLFVYASGILGDRPRRAQALRIATVALAVLFAGASLRAHPDYLPYFNVLAGGPDRGIDWLDDSNVDWGQDLPLLRDFLQKEGIEDVTLAPMAWYDPALYGVRARVVSPEEILRLLTSPDTPPGVYAASAHLLTRGRYDPDAPVDPLSDLEPIAVLGHSIYVFRR